MKRDYSQIAITRLYLGINIITNTAIRNTRMGAEQGTHPHTTHSGRLLHFKSPQTGKEAKGRATTSSSWDGNRPPLPLPFQISTDGDRRTRRDLYRRKISVRDAISIDARSAYETRSQWTRDRRTRRDLYRREISVRDAISTYRDRRTRRDIYRREIGVRVGSRDLRYRREISV
jgi:hypothetical protein